MTTKHSPYRKLKAQADKIAQTLKAALRGESAELAEARKKPVFNMAIAMDDKVLTITMPWTLVETTNEAALSEYIVDQMREARDVAN